MPGAAESNDAAWTMQMLAAQRTNRLLHTALLSVLPQSCCCRPAVLLLLLWMLLQSVDDVSTIAGGGEKFSAILLSVLRAPRLR